MASASRVFAADFWVDWTGEPVGQRSFRSRTRDLALASYPRASVSRNRGGDTGIVCSGRTGLLDSAPSAGEHRAEHARLRPW